MAVESKTFRADPSAIPSAGESDVNSNRNSNSSDRSLGIPFAWRRYFVWAQIVIVFLLLEFALWAPTTPIRNRWAVVAMFTLRLPSAASFAISLL